MSHFSRAENETKGRSPVSRDVIRASPAVRFMAEQRKEKSTESNIFQIFWMDGERERVRSKIMQTDKERKTTTK